MSRTSRLLLLLCLAGLLSGCSLGNTYRKNRYLESGKRFAQEGKISQATIEFKNAIQLDPKFTPAHYELGKLANKAGNATMAFMEFSEVIERDPANFDAQVQLGKLMLARGDAAGARGKAKLVLKSQPDDYDAHLVLAATYAYTDDPKLGVEEALNTVKLSPKRPEAYLTAARLQELMHDFPAAAQNYQQALALAPENLGVLLGVAQNSLRLGKPDDADRYLQKAIAVAGNSNPQPRLMRVALLLQTGRFAEAEALARDTQKAMPDISEAQSALGDVYLAVNDLGRALSEYERLFQAHPDDIRTRKNYTQLLILLGRIDQARKINDPMVRLIGSDPEVVLQRGEILMREGRAGDAVRVLQKAIDLQPNSYMGHYQLGRALVMTDSLEEAQHQLEEAVRIQPDRAEANLALADLAVRKHDLDLLSRVRATLTRIAPNSAVGYQLKAAEELARHQPAQAEADFKKAIEIEPGNPSGYSRYAEFLLVDKKRPEAEAVLKKAISAVPGNYESYNLLVLSYLEQKRTKDALDLLDSAPGPLKETSAMYCLRGSVLLAMNDVAGAQPVLDKAISLNAHNSEAWLMRARCSVLTGQVDKAIETYDSWARAIPSDSRPLLIMGELYDRKGNYQRAQEQYRKALASDPENPFAANNLAFSLLEHGGSPGEALTFAQRARRGDPNSDVTADTLGWAYCQTGDYRTGTKFLEEAVQKAPENPLYHYHLGAAYEATRNYPQATSNYKKVLQLDPNFSHSDQILQAFTRMNH